MTASTVQSSVFENIYASGYWRDHRAAGTADVPSSGAGSTVRASHSTCVTLLEAVRRTSEANSHRHVRILDAPCGDFTWMPSCLTRIAAELHVAIHYQGGDIVRELVQQLNEGRGRFLPNGVRTAIGSGVTLREFVHLDATDVEAMRRLRGRFDILISRHVTIHLQSNAVLRLIDGWNALDPRYILTDDYAVGRNINWIDANASAPHREINLREPPFSLPDPECSQPDASLCDSTPKCLSNVNLFVPPLQHGAIEPTPSVGRRGIYVHKDDGDPATLCMRRSLRKLRLCTNASFSETERSRLRPRARALADDFSSAWHKLYTPDCSSSG